MSVRHRFARAFVLSALAGLLVASSLGGCQRETGGEEKTEVEQESVGRKEGMIEEKRIVEAACGQCQFGLPGDGCDLAIRYDGAAYFVDGTDIDQHGDAHAADGFCNAIRQAEVAGRIENGRLVVTVFNLLPEEDS